MIKAKKIAYDLKSWFGTACSEIGHEEQGYGTEGDCQGDELYNDDNTALDLLSDRVGDETGRDADLAHEVIGYLAQMMHWISPQVWDTMRRYFPRSK